MPIALETSHDDVRRWAGSWLDGLSLHPPVPLALSIRVAEVPPPSDARAPFVQPEVEIRSGPPSHDVVVDWRVKPARAVLRRHERRADCVISPAAAADIEGCCWSFLTATLVFLLRRAGWHHVHGATAEDPSGRGWLLAGDSRSGKSTTAALLAARGWRVGCDDLAFLARGPAGALVHAARAPIRVREGGLALLERAAPRRARGKGSFTPEELGGAWLPSVRPDIIALPSVNGGRSSARAASPSGALAALVRWSAWVALEPDYADEHLALIGELAAQATCVELSLGPDLFEREDALMGLLP